MEINPEIKAILKASKIDVDQGLIYLLSIYHEINCLNVIPEEIGRKVVMLKITERDYTSKTITWNIPLFKDQEEVGAFAWCKEWKEPFLNIGGPARGGTMELVVRRMKQWFAKHPEYRKEDVFAARDLYFYTEKPQGKHVKTSYRFIRDGEGKEEVSLLLLWCERVKELGAKTTTNPYLKGKIM